MELKSQGSGKVKGGEMGSSSNKVRLRELEVSMMLKSWYRGKDVKKARKTDHCGLRMEYRI